MANAAPIDMNAFSYNYVLLAEANNHSRHPRAALNELRAILRPTKAADHEPDNHVSHWWEAQLLHYGLRPSKTKAVAKTRLLDALNQGTLTVPGDIAKQEADLKKQWEKKERDARKTTTTSAAATKGTKRKTLQDEVAPKSPSAKKPKAAATPTKAPKPTAKSAKAVTTKAKAPAATPAKPKMTKATPAKPKTTKATPAKPKTTKAPTKDLMTSVVIASPVSTKHLMSGLYARRSRPLLGSSETRVAFTRRTSEKEDAAPGSSLSTHHFMSGLFARRSRPLGRSSESRAAFARRNSEEEEAAKGPPVTTNHPRPRQFARRSNSGRTPPGLRALFVRNASNDDDDDDDDDDEEDEDDDEPPPDYGTAMRNVSGQPTTSSQPLGLLNGRYEIDCPSLEDWGYTSSDFSLILTLEGASLWGAYDLGQFTGIMRLNTRPYTASDERFEVTWRGVESEGETSFGPSNVGWLEFLGGGKIRGMINCYGRATFEGRRVSGNQTKSERDAKSMRTEWDGYNQEEYDRANRSRWGGSGW